MTGYIWNRGISSDAHGRKFSAHAAHPLGLGVCVHVVLHLAHVAQTCVCSASLCLCQGFWLSAHVAQTAVCTGRKIIAHGPRAVKLGEISWEGLVLRGEQMEMSDIGPGAPPPPGADALRVRLWRRWQGRCYTVPYATGSRHRAHSYGTHREDGFH